MDGNAAWIKNTLIYREWQQMREEILRHKWCESEKAGYDIGWDRAVIDWMIKKGAASFNGDRTESSTP